MDNIDKLEAYELVNSCETAEELEKAILDLGDEDGMIQGRTRKFDARRMSSRVKGVIDGSNPINMLTREFSIRQQALYIQYYQK